VGVSKILENISSNNFIFKKSFQQIF